MPFRGSRGHQPLLGEARTAITPGVARRGKDGKKASGSWTGGNACFLELMVLVARVIVVYGNLLSQALMICVLFCVRIVNYLEVFLEMQ